MPVVLHLHRRVEPEGGLEPLPGGRPHGDGLHRRQRARQVGPGPACGWTTNPPASMSQEYFLYSIVFLLGSGEFRLLTTIIQSWIFKTILPVDTAWMYSLELPGHKNAPVRIQRNV